jgi:tagatose 6-phosphate kinase
MIIFLSTTPALQRTMIFPRLAVDAVNRATQVIEYASGKNINGARVARALGEAVVATGVLGGETGRRIAADLDTAGIARDFIDVSPPTRMCVTAVDRAAGTATELIEEAAEIADDDGDRLLNKLGDLMEEADVLVLSGKLAPGVGNAFYARCVRLAREVDVPTVLDARGEPLRLALAEHPTIIKPNRSELAETVGLDRFETDDQFKDAIRDSISGGAQWVVVTQGAKDTIVSDGRSFHAIETPRVKVVNPIGSGDSLAAGLAVGLRRGMDVLNACVLGVACGAANAMTELAGHVSREDVERLQHEIAVRAI